jgi:xanthine/CO dehydrogenase XdhC/CoxF family maturation factor
MLLTLDGRRAGTVSGGCLEAQVTSRAWWLTENGPRVERYSTAEEDGERPYGSGCGGVVFLLLERRGTASPLLAALEEAFTRRTALAVATVLEGEDVGRRAFAGLEERRGEGDSLQGLAELALAGGKSMEKKIAVEGIEVRVWTDFRPARPGLRIFGAGDDAQPLVRMAKELGWFVTVADGRSHLATRARFPLADEVRVLQISEMPGEHAAVLGDFHARDAAVLMTHSFDQDARILASLLALDAPLAYIGVLGTQRRTREVLVEVARLLNLPEVPAEQWLAQLHSPMGLDLGADSPETIGLCVVAEIQKSLVAATGLPLREVRGASSSR